jgi:hypothetical protein
MNAKKAKALRKAAEKYTKHLPDVSYTDGRLGECTRGAYRALKRQRWIDRRESATIAE